MNSFKCAICLKVFDRKTNYIRHLNRKYHCKKIEQKIPKVGSLSQNKDNIEYNDKNTCSYCSNIYINIIVI